MRPPQLILLIVCFIFLPILLTTISLFSSHSPSSESPRSVSGSTSRFKAFFSFRAPSSLFPPSAIISLTDDNSTFFLARPAAFGPVLPEDGLSGPLWIGSGFGDDSHGKGGLMTGAEGELGCSDVPGWEDGDKNQKKKEFENRHGDEKLKTGRVQADPETGNIVHEKRASSDTPNPDVKPSADAVDGTDDHLHRPLSELRTDQAGGNGASGNMGSTHADIQSLQETAEITGKVVLLSRGGCGFLEKVKWVQRRGGVALIVGDDTRGGGLVTMYARDDTSNVTIPSLFTSHTTAHLLSSLIPPENPEESGPNKPQPSGLNSNKQSKKNGQNGNLATPTKAASATSTPLTASYAKPGIFRSVLSVLGLSNKSYPRHIHGDSRRPPSSGNLDWVVRDPVNGNKASASPSSQTSDRKGAWAPSPRATRDIDSQESAGDNFIIGVQDWRDPDLVDLPKASISTSSASSSLPPGSRSTAALKNQNSAANNLKGGSITPGSGEYVGQDKQSKGKTGTNNAGQYYDVQSKQKPGSRKYRGHWWPDAFRWDDENEESDSRVPPALKPGFGGGAAVKPTVATDKDANAGNKPAEHEGLWVTLTPTSMATSPFFDTLLVLVVSPLVTLTVVYALLLLRSRIRRRRWRAPKAVVDRLPIRTYHTMSPRSRTPRTGTPGTSSPSSPLLSHSISPQGRPRSQTACGSVNTSSRSLNPAADGSPCNAEKSSSATMLSRRKYAGKQVECVVCLEEYIDGQSQIMSLPCGHEFHAQCM